MAIVIKKVVALDFLGSDYKDANLTFQSIPIKDFDDITSKIEKAQESGKSATFVLEILKQYFISGNFPDIDTVTKDDLDGLDQETVLTCFSVLTGQEINKQTGEVAEVADLKEEPKKPSLTEAQPHSS